VNKQVNTTVVRISEGNPNPPEMAGLGEIIKKGGLVAFPTETVYGLGGDALNPESSKKIYAAKGRPSDNPLIVHIADLNDLPKLVVSVPERAKKLADAFWPGPLTMILNKSDLVPTETTGGLSTVAVRFPSHKVAQELIKASGGYIAAPSANLSGKPSPTLAKYVLEDMDGRVDAIIDGGDIPIGLESTIVDLTGEKPMILRPGYITKEMLESVLGEVLTDPTILDASCKERPKAPGMRYRHYAPKGELTIVEGPADAVIETINLEVLRSSGESKKTGVIASDENVPYYSADVVKCIGNRNNPEEVAASLYRILREMDDENVEAIFSESFSEEGLGEAIMNRLLKAAGHRKITV
jgi:L-threonylcarbamoyladenylate synthase